MYPIMEKLTLSFKVTHHNLAGLQLLQSVYGKRWILNKLMALALALALKVHRAVLQAQARNIKLDLAPKLDLKPMVLDLKLAHKLDLKPMVLKADLGVKVMDLIAKKVLLVALQALKLPLLHMDLDLDLKVVPTLLDLKPMVQAQAQAQAQALKPMVPIPVLVLVRQIMDLEVRVLQVALQALKVMDLNQEVKVVVLNPMVLVL
jgi:hypothetical protein